MSHCVLHKGVAITRGLQKKSVLFSGILFAGQSSFGFRVILSVNGSPSFFFPIFSSSSSSNSSVTFSTAFRLVVSERAHVTKRTPEKCAPSSREEFEKDPSKLLPWVISVLKAYTTFGQPFLFGLLNHRKCHTWKIQRKFSPTSTWSITISVFPLLVRTPPLDSNEKIETEKS